VINVQHKSWPGTVVVVWPKYLPHLLLLLLLYPPQLHRSLHQKQEELEPEVGYKACRDTDRVGTVVAVHADTNTFDIKWPDTSEIETGLSYTPSESTSDGDEDEGEKETAEEAEKETAEEGETEAAEEVEKEAAEEVEQEMHDVEEEEEDDGGQIMLAEETQLTEKDMNQYNALLLATDRIDHTVQALDEKLLIMYEFHCSTLQLPCQLATQLNLIPKGGDSVIVLSDEEDEDEMSSADDDEEEMVANSRQTNVKRSRR
jgi:hypothetical protein